VALVATALNFLAFFLWYGLGLALVLPLQLGVQLESSGVLSQATFILAVVLVTYVFRHALDRQSFKSLGFQPGPGWLGELAVGFGLGAGLMMLIALTELAFGAYRLGPPAWQARSVDQILLRLGLWFGAFVVVAFYEELFARGYILQNLAGAWGLPVGVMVSSALFSLGHLFNPGASLISTLGLFCAGVLLAAGYVFTHRLWLPIGLHLSWNFFQGPVLGFPVSGLPTGGLLSLEPVGPELLSGGRFGPEASLVGIAATFLGISLLLWWRRSHLPAKQGTPH
jgi:membrane protease YdiL (CAAX protease family)